MSDSLLMIFVKNLVRGKVKTRLAKDIGKDAAVDVFLELIRHTNRTTRNLAVDKNIYYSDYPEMEDLWRPGIYTPHIQKGNTLGEKMARAFEDAFCSYRKVIIIGSDCYDLTSAIINEAFVQLEKNDMVVGPARDGGYYLLGMKEFAPQLFHKKKYGTESVLEELTDEVHALGRSIHKLPVLTDIDTLTDLRSSDIQWGRDGKGRDRNTLG